MGFKLIFFYDLYWYVSFKNKPFVKLVVIIHNFYAIRDGYRRCLSFARSSPGQLTLGPRQQINMLSSYLDASSVYGSDECREKKATYIT